MILKMITGVWGVLVVFSSWWSGTALDLPISAVVAGLVATVLFLGFSWGFC